MTYCISFKCLKLALIKWGAFSTCLRAKQDLDLANRNYTRMKDGLKFWRNWNLSPLETLAIEDWRQVRKHEKIGKPSLWGSTSCFAESQRRIGESNGNPMHFCTDNCQANSRDSLVNQADGSRTIKEKEKNHSRSKNGSQISCWHVS